MFSGVNWNICSTPECMGMGIVNINTPAAIYVKWIIRATERNMGYKILIRDDILEGLLHGKLGWKDSSSLTLWQHQLLSKSKAPLFSREHKGHRKAANRIWSGMGMNLDPNLTFNNYSNQGMYVLAKMESHWEIYLGMMLYDFRNKVKIV